MTEQMKKFGGSMWDTLFILISHDDMPFVLQFVNRIPCEKCKTETLRKLNSHKNESLTKDQLYMVLWKIRTKIDPKYTDMNTMTHLKNYLSYLQLI